MLGFVERFGWCLNVFDVLSGHVFAHRCYDEIVDHVHNMIQYVIIFRFQGTLFFWKHESCQQFHNCMAFDHLQLYEVHKLYIYIEFYRCIFI